ncbi:MAG: glycine betaine/proline transport system permease protein [Ilumatobacter sp.]|jgi:glycine betaine/proline transport system permease protein
MSVALSADRSVGIDRKWWPWVVLLAGFVALQTAFSSTESFPIGLDRTFSDPLDDVARWSQRNRRDHWLFTYLFNPITDLVRWGLDTVESMLLWVPWFVLPLAVFVFIARTRRWKQATFAALALLYPGLFDMWEVTVETLALMTIAVVLCVLIGLPLGVFGALRPRAAQVMRPVLDAMQTVPAPVYFVPMALFFGIGAVPATLATVVYALPPVVRLTTLGIGEVSPQAVEASKMFGGTTFQTLRKVQLPMAMPTILTGIAQSIMMALGIVVLATLLGAGGLGQEVMDTLSQRRTGRGIATGLAIVSVAIVLERLGRAAASPRGSDALPRKIVWGAVGGLVVLVIVGRAGSFTEFPAVWDVKLFDPIDTGIDWVRDNLRWLTRWINDTIVIRFYLPVRDLLTDTIAWPALVFAVGWIGWRLNGWPLAVFNSVSLLVIGLIGMWELTLDTFTQVLAAVAVAVAIAVPIGVWAGRSPRIEAVLSPILDGLQTVPSLVYIIPAVTLFTLGVVPGIIASVLYAVVPGIRITALGIKQVAPESVEASQMFGATPRQTMLGVRIPLAATTIMTGINQVIMMVLAMVIISGLVGGGGLGFETISAVKNSEVGLGFEVGLAIVLMAIVLDRCTQAIGQRLQPPTSADG